MKPSILLALLPLVFGSCDRTNQWTPLFNGETLDGWEFDILDGSPGESIYAVNDGVMVVKGAGQSKAVIRTAHTFRNFELQFEWRWPAQPGNGGCLIYCSKPRKRSIWPQSLEIQLQSGNAGDFIHIGESIVVPENQIPQNLPPNSWKTRLRWNLTDDSEKPPGEWNAMHITAKDGVVSVYINGDLVNRGTDCSASEGAICLQAEGADIDFRNIRLRDL